MEEKRAVGPPILVGPLRGHEAFRSLWPHSFLSHHFPGRRGGCSAVSATADGPRWTRRPDLVVGMFASFLFCVVFLVIFLRRAQLSWQVVFAILYQVALLPSCPTGQGAFLLGPDGANLTARQGQELVDDE